MNSPTSHQHLLIFTGNESSVPELRRQLSTRGSGLGRVLIASLLVFVISAVAGSAANILWVSDASPGSATGGVFSGPGTGYTDSGFVTLLQNAGHNINRFNSADGQAILLTDTELAAINTNDLVIIGRASGSATYQVGAGTGGGPGQGSNWNAQVTKPLICMSPYLVRTIAANRMGWFLGDVGPDNTPAPLAAADAANPAVDFLFGEAAMIGTNTAQVFDELIDRNTSTILGAPVAGGRLLATATFAREDTGAIVTGNMIADWPAGTVVAGGSNILGGYRMYFAGGSREGATAPNAISIYTGRENLTPSGESTFLRAVQLALNSGVPPAVNPAAPVGFTTRPASATVPQFGSVTFSVSVTGAAPRTLQWQRDTGDAVTFTNIPGATTTFSSSSYTLPVVTTADHNARFRVVATNPNNSVTSTNAVLSVVPDRTPPVLLLAGSMDGNSIALCFSEKLNNSNMGATDVFSYSVNAGSVTPSTATLQLDGRTVILQLNSPVSGGFTVQIEPTATLLDFADNALVQATSLVSNRVANLTSAPIGMGSPAGSVAVCGPGSVKVTAGSLDLATTIDVFHFAYKTVTGDFEARARVTSLSVTSRLESVAKAILSARESTATNSAAVNVFVTPPTPGNNSVSSSVRTAAGAVTNTLGTSIIGGSVPRWLRIQRVGNVFTTATSTDGVTWVTLGSTNAALSPTLLVGVGATSHRTVHTITAEFTDVAIGPLPILFTPAYAAGSFSGSFQTQTGFDYRVEYKNGINPGPWTPLTVLPGNGMMQTFRDPGPVSPTASRIYRALAY